MKIDRVELSAKSQDHASFAEVVALEKAIDGIGLARFVGRINAGLIEPDLGFQAVALYVSREKERPLLSKIAQILTGNANTYAKGG